MERIIRNQFCNTHNDWKWSPSCHGDLVGWGHPPSQPVNNCIRPHSPSENYSFTNCQMERPAKLSDPFLASARLTSFIHSWGFTHHAFKWPKSPGPSCLDYSVSVSPCSLIIWGNTLIFCLIFSYSVSLQSVKAHFKWLHLRKEMFAWVNFRSILKGARQIVNTFGVDVNMLLIYGKLGFFAVGRIILHILDWFR